MNKQKFNLSGVALAGLRRCTRNALPSLEETRKISDERVQLEKKFSSHVSLIISIVKAIFCLEPIFIMKDKRTISSQIALKANVKPKLVQSVLSAVRDEVAGRLLKGESANTPALAIFKIKNIPAKPARKKRCFGKDR